MGSTGLKSKIANDLKTALKSKNEAKVSTLRMVLSEIHNLEIDKKREATAEDALSVLWGLAKQHADSIAQFQTGGRTDLVEKEQRELAIIREYLPAQLTEQELKQIVDAAIAEAGVKSAADFGAVMKVLMPKVKHRASGATVSQMVKEQLTPFNPNGV